MAGLSRCGNTLAATARVVKRDAVMVERDAAAAAASQGFSSSSSSTAETEAHAAMQEAHGDGDGATTHFPLSEVQVGRTASATMRALARKDTTS